MSVAKSFAMSIAPSPLKSPGTISAPLYSGVIENTVLSARVRLMVTSS
jgi:hypothetical protein